MGDENYPSSSKTSSSKKNITQKTREGIGSVYNTTRKLGSDTLTGVNMARQAIRDKINDAITKRNIKNSMIKLKKSQLGEPLLSGDENYPSSSETSSSKKKMTRKAREGIGSVYIVLKQEEMKN